MITECSMLKGNTDHNILLDVGQSMPDQAFDSTRDAKKVQVHPTDPKKTTSIAFELNSAYESVLIEFLRECWEIFALCPADMPGFPGNLLSTNYMWT
jgi:hypothetical protein